MQNADEFQGFEGFVQDVTSQNAGHKMMSAFLCVWSNISNEHTRPSKFEFRKWSLFLSFKKRVENTASAFERVAYIH